MFLWLYNEKRATGKHCDDWKDQSYIRQRKIERNDAGKIRAK